MTPATLRTPRKRVVFTAIFAIVWFIAFFALADEIGWQRGYDDAREVNAIERQDAFACGESYQITGKIDDICKSYGVQP